MWGIWKLSVLLSQFFCKSKTVLKIKFILLKIAVEGFPGGAVVKNPPANTGDMGLSPGPGRFHMLWSN